MKLAVISDLHGNYYALAKVLAFLRSQEIDVSSGWEIL